MTNEIKQIFKVAENNVLRAILRKKKMDKISIIELHRLAGLEDFEDRILNLRSNYFRATENTANPLTLELREDFLRFKGGRTLSYKTPLDDIEELLNISEESLPIRQVVN